MVTKNLKEDVKIKISLQDYAIINNIPFMILEGFKTHLNCKLTDLQDEKELDKSYKKYLETPGFI